MRGRMAEMHREMQAFVAYVRDRMLDRSSETEERIQNALVRVAPPFLARARTRRATAPRGEDKK